MFYTDGSKTADGEGKSVYSNNTIKMIKFPDFCSIYTAEAYAICHAFKIIKQNKIEKVLLLSDSQSALNSISNTNQPNTISKIIQFLNSKFNEIKLSITLWPKYFSIS